MKILNTAQDPIILLFKRRLSVTAQQPTPNAEILFRKMAHYLSPFVGSLGLPGVQLFCPKLFEYGGREFEIDTSWIYPDDAIDGIQASFMTEYKGQGFQFILFDHQQIGTVENRYFLPENVDSLPMMVWLYENYCSKNRNRPYTIP